MAGLYLKPKDGPVLAELIREHRRKPRAASQPPAPPPWTPRPPIVVMLLEDLHSGGRARAAVMTVVETNETQMVTVRGEVDGGDFVLSFDGTTWTDAIPWDATADEVRTALEGLPQINPGDVIVTAGEATLFGTTYKPGRWTVQFAGQYEGVDVPLLQVDYNGRGDSVGLDAVTNFAAWVVVATECLEWTGETETVRNVIPVPDPTPLVAPCICQCKHFPGIGYVVDAVEVLDFDVLDY